MKNRPYTIYVSHRPLRTGFLIDTGAFTPGSARFDELVDAVMGFNFQTWGGRTNPIIFFSGEHLSTDDWKQLQTVDVDCVRAFTSLPQKLLEELDERLQPWSVEITDLTKPDEPVRVGAYGIATPPTPENLRFFGDAKFVLFDFAPGCEPIIQRFIHRNFGTYFQWIQPKTGAVRREMWLENLLVESNVKHVCITDRRSLGAALTLLAGTVPGTGYQSPLRFVAPVQLTSLHLGEPWPLWDMNHVYQVIVGDTPGDLAEHWNGVFWTRTWAKPYEHYLWLPTDLAREPMIRDGLQNWLRYYTRTGNSDAKDAEFFSASLPPAELDAVRQEICSGHRAWTPRSHVAQAEIVARRKRKAEEEALTRRALVLSNTDDAIRYSAISEQETLSLTKPEILTDMINVNGVWMVDVQIEQVSPQQPTAPEQSWWIAPRLNGGGLVFSIFGSAARVNRHCLFSVRVENQSGPYTRHVKPELKIHLPPQLSIVPQLITQPENLIVFTADARYKKMNRQRPIDRVRYSDKGGYLHGLIRVFGDFWTAKDFCERRFWRQMFAKLANRNTRRDATLRQNITNFLIKRSSANDDPDYLADRILGLLRGRPASGIALPYSEFKQQLDELANTPQPAILSYPQGNTIVQHHGVTHLTEEEMRDGLNQLIELNVLRPGVYVRCLFCGIRTWYHVDDLKQQVRCPGCGREQAIGTQQEWCYALNSLAEMSVLQGQLAVMQALAALASHHHESFFFSPSLDLFKPGATEPWHEIDVAAVAEGEFVIGEVKEGDITKNDFDELADIAEALRPQRAIMFLSHENIAAGTMQMLEATRQRLSPRGITVQIFALPAF